MLKKIKCKLFGMHNWTCAAEEGINPTKEQLEYGTAGFWDYAKMYCKDCGHVSKYSKRLLNECSEKKS